VRSKLGSKECTDITNGRSLCKIETVTLFSGSNPELVAFLDAVLTGSPVTRTIGKKLNVRRLWSYFAG
jgi:hypothetical protein